MLKLSENEIDNNLESIPTGEVKFKQWRRVDLTYNDSIIKKSQADRHCVRQSRIHHRLQSGSV